MAKRKGGASVKGIQAGKSTKGAKATNPARTRPAGYPPPKGGGQGKN